MPSDRDEWLAKDGAHSHDVPESRQINLLDLLEEFADDQSAPPSSSTAERIFSALEASIEKHGASLKTNDRMVSIRSRLASAIRQEKSLDYEGLATLMEEIARGPGRGKPVAMMLDLVEIHVDNPARLPELAELAAKEPEFIRKFVELVRFSDKLNSHLGYILDSSIIESIRRQIDREVTSPELSMERLTQVFAVVDGFTRCRWGRASMPERVSLMLDMLEATRVNRHLEIPIEKLLNAPTETLRFARDRIVEAGSSFSDPRQEGTAEQYRYNGSRALMKTCNLFKIHGDSWLYIPCAEGSLASRLQMQGVFLNVASGHVSPAERSLPVPLSTESVVQDQLRGVSEYLQEYLSPSSLEKNRMYSVAGIGTEERRLPFPTFSNVSERGRPSLANQMTEYVELLQGLSIPNQEGDARRELLIQALRQEIPLDLVKTEVTRVLSRMSGSTTPLQGVAAVRPFVEEVRTDPRSGQQYVEMKLPGNGLTELAPAVATARPESLTRVTSIRLYADGTVAVGGEFVRNRFRTLWAEPVVVGHVSDLMRDLERDIHRIPDVHQRREALSALEEIRAVSQDKPIDLRRAGSNPAVIALWEISLRIGGVEMPLRVRTDGSLLDSKFRLQLAAAEFMLEQEGTSVTAAVEKAASMPLPSFDLTLNEARRYIHLRMNRVPDAGTQPTDMECLQMLRLEQSFAATRTSINGDPARLLLSVVRLRAEYSGFSDTQLLRIAETAHHILRQNGVTYRESVEASIYQSLWGIPEQTAIRLATDRVRFGPNMPAFSEIQALASRVLAGKTPGDFELRCLSDALLIRRDLPETSEERAYQLAVEYNRKIIRLGWAHSRVTLDEELIHALMGSKDRVPRRDGLVVAELRAMFPGLRLPDYLELLPKYYELSCFASVLQSARNSSKEPGPKASIDEDQRPVVFPDNDGGSTDTVKTVMEQLLREIQVSKVSGEFANKWQTELAILTNNWDEENVRRLLHLQGIPKPTADQVMQRLFYRLGATLRLPDEQTSQLLSNLWNRPRYHLPDRDLPPDPPSGGSGGAGRAGYSLPDKPPLPLDQKPNYRFGERVFRAPGNSIASDSRVLSDLLRSKALERVSVDHLAALQFLYEDLKEALPVEEHARWGTLFDARNLEANDHGRVVLRLNEEQKRTLASIGSDIVLSKESSPDQKARWNLVLIDLQQNPNSPGSASSVGLDVQRILPYRPNRVSIDQKGPLAEIPVMPEIGKGAVLRRPGGK